MQVCVYIYIYIYNTHTYQPYVRSISYALNLKPNIGLHTLDAETRTSSSERLDPEACLALRTPDLENRSVNSEQGIEVYYTHICIYERILYIYMYTE